MPQMAGAMRFSDLYLGLSIVPIGGGNTRYARNLLNLVQFPNGGGPPDTGTLGVSLNVGSINPTLAYKITDNQTLGASWWWASRSSERMASVTFTTFTLSQTGDKLTNQGNDWSVGAGARVGWTGNFFGDAL